MKHKIMAGRTSSFEVANVHSVHTFLEMTYPNVQHPAQIAVVPLGRRGLNSGANQEALRPARNFGKLAICWKKFPANFFSEIHAWTIQERSLF